MLPGSSSFGPSTTLCAIPADNVHPGQLRVGFSSAGCLILPGFYKGGRHTGIWNDFRSAAGIHADSNGQQCSLMLLTGLDVALAASSRTGSAGAIRPRHGSTGARTAALQAALGLAHFSMPQRVYQTLETSLLRL